MAHMPDASLPDRVEAARALHRMLLDNDDATIDISQGVLRRIIGGALAAADACEAERTSDAVWGWARETNLPLPVMSGGYQCQRTAERPPGDGWYQLFTRRPVSSEDVHREAAE